MITTIRSQFKQTRYAIFFMVFVIALSMVSSLFMRTERSISSWACKVNGAEISHQELTRETAKQSAYITQIRSKYGQIADLLFQSWGWSLDPKVRALDLLIKQELVDQYATNLGIVLDADYISKAINNAKFVKENLGHIIPAFAFDQSGMLDMSIVKNFLRQNNISIPQFEKEIEQALVQSIMMNMLVSSSYVPQFDIRQHFIAKNLGKKFSYLTFSFDQFLAEEKKHAISDEDLKTFYDAQNIQFRRYWVSEKRTAFVWKFEPKNYNILISDQEIQEYYDDNKVKSYVLEPLKVEIQQITADQINKVDAASFEEVRNDLVTNPDSAWKNAWKSLKPFSRGERKGEIEKAAFVLQNEGDISPVFETRNEGLTIVRLVKRIPRIYKPLASVKNEIRNILMTKAFKKNLVKDIKEIVSRNDQQAIENFIAEKKGKKEIAANISKDSSRFAQELFSLKRGAYAFYVENDTGIVIQFSDAVDRHLPDLDSIKDIVKGDLYEQRAKISLETAVSKATIQAEKSTFAELYELFNVSYNTTPMLNSTNKQLKELEKQGLPVQTMIDLEKIGSILSYNSERNSYLIKLDEIEAFNENKFLELESDIKNHLGSVRTRLLLDGFVDSLHRNATIETNESILIAGEEYSE